MTTSTIHYRTPFESDWLYTTKSRINSTNVTIVRLINRRSLARALLRESIQINVCSNNEKCRGCTAFNCTTTLTVRQAWYIDGSFVKQLIEDELLRPGVQGKWLGIAGQEVQAYGQQRTRTPSCSTAWHTAGQSFRRFQVTAGLILACSENPACFVFFFLFSFFFSLAGCWIFNFWQCPSRGDIFLCWYPRERKSTAWRKINRNCQMRPTWYMQKQTLKQMNGGTPEG